MKNKKIRIYIITTCLLVIFTQSAFSQLTSKADSILEKRGEICFSFEYSNRAQLNNISKIISIDKVTQNSAFAYANKREFRKFLALNIPYTIQPNSTEIAHEITMFDKTNTKDIAVWDAYPTYSAYVSMMIQFQTNYPNLCKIDTILNSTPGGRQILVAKLTNNVNVAADKPQFLYTSSIHGDEATGYVLMLRLIDYLLSNYGTNTRVTNLMDNIEIWINPAANPDGTYAGGNSSVSGATRYNQNNVDLNRNYPDPIAGSHNDGETWQPETQAFMNFASAHNFVMSANFHGGIEIANYTWDCKPELNPDNNWWIYVSKEYADSCKKAASNNGYFTGDGDGVYPGVTNGYGWYLVYGGRQDYMNYWHHCRELTLEISSTKLVPASQLPTFWNYNYVSLLNYLQQATYGFRGIVTDSITGTPLKAKITIIGHDADSTEVYSALPIGNYHRPIEAGTWSLKFEAPGYCPKTISNLTIADKQTIRINTKLISCPQNIDSEEYKDNFLLYPNPSYDGVFNINCLNNEPIYVEIYNIKGQKITEILNNQNTSILLNLAKFNNGIYWAKISSNQGVFVQKIVLAK